MQRINLDENGVSDEECWILWACCSGIRENL